MARRKKQNDIELYSPEELDAIDSHIEKNFGRILDLYEQKDPTDIKTDIAVIAPTRKYPYFTLVTRGMGAHVMNTANKSFSRAELVICMPANWDPDSKNDKDSWVFDLLSNLSRLPINKNAWLGWGHSVDYCKPFNAETDLCAVVLLNAMFGRDSWRCKLPEGDHVNFYQIIPVYRIELDYKNSRNVESLINIMGDDLSPVVYLNRQPLVNEMSALIVDSVTDHSSKISKKELDLPDICGANHISAYFRWCMENGLLDREFSDFMAEELEQIRAGKLDVRTFLIQYMNGELTLDSFSEEGEEFTRSYYEFYSPSGTPSYPSDVDHMALDFFGEEKYNCDEFQDEAYLFVPFDDAYFSAISRYIAKNYRAFRRNKKKKKEKEDN